MRAVILLSGGLDSATVLAMAKQRRRECLAMSIVYGQRHEVELRAAQRVAATIGVAEHVVFPLDLRVFGASALTSDIDVPKDAVGAPGIPVTYVPARNTIFLSLALGYAEAKEASEIWIGVNAVDYSGYPDCRPEFIDAFQQVILRGSKSGEIGRASCRERVSMSVVGGRRKKKPKKQARPGLTEANDWSSAEGNRRQRPPSM